MTSSSAENQLPVRPLREVKTRHFLGWMAIFMVLMGLVFILDLSYGSLKIPAKYIVRILSGIPTDMPIWRDIILNIRLTKAITAVLVGSGLAISGLLMQTFFRNPLADPFILGINSGASLGVALAILSVGTVGSLFMTHLTTMGDLGVAAAAITGAALVFGLVMVVARSVKSSNTLLILGLMFGYATSALVSLLIYFSLPERIQAYMIWTYGSFGGVTWSQLKVMAPVMLVGIVISIMLGKSLNALLLGEDYARSLGLNLTRTRFFILLGASVLAGAATAFCGPIGFLGVAIPHVARDTAAHVKPQAFNSSCVGSRCKCGAFGRRFVATAGNRLYPANQCYYFSIGAPFVLWIILRRKAGSGVSI